MWFNSRWNITLTCASVIVGIMYMNYYKRIWKKHPTLALDHLHSVDQLTSSHMNVIFDIAREMEHIVNTEGTCDRLHGKLLANVFYEPSTRTNCSFQAAMLRLGGNVLSFQEANSSTQKGETLSDTIRSLECYCDIIALRHPIKDCIQKLMPFVSVPIINAGDGVGEHPTQALLYIYTIQRELGTSIRNKPWKIAIVGDLKNGQTVHSMIKLIVRHYSVVLDCVSPVSLQLPSTIRDIIGETNTIVHELTLLDPILNQCNVLYMTRIQKERFLDEAEYNRVRYVYCIDRETLSRARSDMIVMHPLPRVREIHPDVDSDPRAAYFRQMKNGLYVRMALLILFLEANNKDTQKQ